LIVEAHDGQTQAVWSARGAVFGTTNEVKFAAVALFDAVPWSNAAGAVAPHASHATS